MANVTNISAGQFLNFDLNTKLLVSDYRNVKLLGIINYDMAMTFDDVEAVHKNIIGSLPVGTPAQARDYNYLMVLMPNGSRRVVGAPWIKEPITVVSTVVYNVQVRDGGSDGALLIKKALSAYGITDFTITTDAR